MSDTKTTTYVLVGNDHNNAAYDAVKLLQQRERTRGDVRLIFADSGQPLTEALQKIPPSSHIILLAHGNEQEQFTWRRDENIGYFNLLRNLPEDTASVTIGGCYGGTSQEKLLFVPNGTILLTNFGHAFGMRHSVTQTFQEVGERAQITPLSLLLESLDNTSPEQYRSQVERHNHWISGHPDDAKKRNITPLPDFNPDALLPSVIAIGGVPPQRIDLNDTLKSIAGHSKNETLKTEAFDRAVATVKEHFDSQSMASAGSPGQNEDVREAVDDVADKLRKGKNPESFTLEEKRIGYALAASYLFSTGIIDRMAESARQQSPWQELKSNPDTGWYAPTPHTEEPLTPSTVPLTSTPTKGIITR